MNQFKTMNKKVIELFDEKTGDVIRTFCFSNLKEFYEFVKGFNEKKYPGYGCSQGAGPRGYGIPEGR